MSDSALGLLKRGNICYQRILRPGRIEMYYSQTYRMVLFGDLALLFSKCITAGPERTNHCLTVPKLVRKDPGTQHRDTGMKLLLYHQPGIDLTRHFPTGYIKFY